MASVWSFPSCVLTSPEGGVNVILLPGHYLPNRNLARVNGGFMITRSKPSSGNSATIWVADSSPVLPVRLPGSLVLKQRHRLFGLHQFQRTDLHSSV